MIFDMVPNMCHYASDNAVYRNTKGLIVNPSGTSKGFFIERFRIAENEVSLALRAGTYNVHINSNYAENIWISASLFPDCPECYTTD